jgi:tetratricopeptide (TPR) repeat protein
MIPNRRCTIDGSKLGFFATTLHNNNILLYNGEYMELFNILIQNPEDIKKLLGRAKQIYNLTKHMASPDITHIYAVILMKVDNFDEAEDYLNLALEQTRKFQGIINNRCDICNNIINLYEKLQSDISTISKNPSKYTNYNLVSLKD